MGITFNNNIPCAVVERTKDGFDLLYYTSHASVAWKGVIAINGETPYRAGLKKNAAEVVAREVWESSGSNIEFLAPPKDFDYEMLTEESIERDKAREEAAAKRIELYGRRVDTPMPVARPVVVVKPVAPKPVAVTPLDGAPIVSRRQAVLAALNELGAVDRDVSIEEISAETGLEVPKLLAELLTLSIQKVVLKNHPAKTYRLLKKG